MIFTLVVVGSVVLLGGLQGLSYYLCYERYLAQKRRDHIALFSVLYDLGVAEAVAIGQVVKTEPPRFFWSYQPSLGESVGKTQEPPGRSAA